jgi:HAD superfamily hydrolase (TIGR01509 family)
MKAYLFDLDGTIAASEVLKARALAQACATYGAKADHLIYADVMGEDWPTVTAHFLKAYDLRPAFDEFNDRFRGFYLDLIETDISETEGATQFILETRTSGIKTGVVSSAATWMVETVLAKLGLQDSFDVIITQEHVARHKPDPEAYLLALSRLGMSARDTLVFEDSSAGMRAATAAGCDCVIVRHAFNRKHDVSGAVREIESFSEILGAAKDRHS